jgi:hypothetical protein
MTVGRGRGASRNRPPRDGTSRDGTLRDGTLRDIDVVAELRSAARTEGERIRVIPLIPGILTDSVGFAAAGWQTVTISRGTIGTLGRIHSTRDDVDHLRGAGIGGAANVLARAATELTRVG